MIKEDLEKTERALLEDIQDAQERYGKNFTWAAWHPEDVKNNNDDPNNWICSGKPKQVFSGRFVAVSGFIYAIVNGKYSVLANLRGPGTPDYQNHWNAICGFLECYENSKEGIQREIYEECQFIVDTDDLKIVHVETEPEECNNGNVTIRHKAFLGKIIPMYCDKSIGGEINEIASVKWIPIDEIDKYKWAFNHKKTIIQYTPKKWIRKIMEFWYTWFRPYNMKYTDEFDVESEDLGYSNNKNMM